MKNFYLTICFTMLFFGVYAQETIVLASTESTDGWTSPHATLSLKPVGSDTGLSGANSLQGTIPVGIPGEVFFERNISPSLDISSIANKSGYLAFSLYVDDVTKYGGQDGVLTISSSGGADANNLRWFLHDLIHDGKIKTGWNHLKLDLASGNSNSPDLTAINYFRLFLVRNDGIATEGKLAINNIRFTHDIDEEGLTFFDKCESADGWIIDVTADNTDFKQGAASLSQTGTDGLRFRKERQALPLNVSGNNFFGLWLYVSDVSKFVGDVPQVRIASNGNGDNQAPTLSWNLPNLVNGWNNLVLPMTGPDVIDGGSFDPATVVAFRFTGGSSEAITTKVDKIAFAATADLLPVSITSFSATAIGNKAKLQWETASETDNSHFIIERSVDDAAFTVIGDDIPSEGAGKYVSYDNNPANGINYYRILQYDKNGTANTFDKVASVNFKLEKKAPLFVYPNPSNGDFNVLYNATGKSGKIGISLSDSNGRTVKSEEVQAEHVNGFRLQTGGSLKAGVYILRVANESVKVIIR